MRFETLTIHGGHEVNETPAHTLPIFQTSTYIFESVAQAQALFAGQGDGYIYGRLGHPNARAVERRLALLEEGAEAVAFATGMAAVSAAVFAYARSGDRILSQRTIYGGTYAFFQDLPRFGIQTEFLDPTDLEALEAALAAEPRPALLYLETPANPTLQVVDLAACSELAHRYGVPVVVDNTFATPYLQRPLELGCDAVVHSATKYLAGHGQALGGFVVGRDGEWVRSQVRPLLKHLGGMLDPFAAWLIDLGMKTLHVRMPRHCENAQRIAEWLADHPLIERVYYPGLADHPGHDVARRQMQGGFGGVLSFEVRGGLEAGRVLMESVRLCSLAVSLGSVDTLIQHPASMTHASVPPEARRAAGISDGLVRLSVGIEAVDDLIEDLAQALEKVEAAVGAI